MAYSEEYFYHNPLVDDTKVVYITSDETITLTHNERNKRQTNISYPSQVTIGIDGQDAESDSGDEGIIRYRIDGDLFTKSGPYDYDWAMVYIGDPGLKFPAYSAPFTFASLKYLDGTTPVVGTTGLNQSITNRTGLYGYGVLDVFGDEWHTITFADDDSFIYSGPDGPWAYASHWEKLASDGKQILFVVNPLTPAIRFVSTGTGQFYTTPPKAYHIPKVHAQTTYMTDDVTIELDNIMSAATCYYRFYTGSPSGDYIAYSAENMAASIALLSDDTPYVLEYYYDSDYKKTRTIVLNPSFPSAGESHGNMLWADSTELDAVIARLSSGNYASWYYYLLVGKDDPSTDRNGRLNWDTNSGSGMRITTRHAFTNAFIALAKGLRTETEYTRVGESKSAALYAKEMCLENVMNLCPLWFGDPGGGITPNPSHELLYRGYYDAMPVMSTALAYDILIAHYKSTDYSDGITAIEDYKIRDSLAKWSMLAMMETGAFGYYGKLNNAQGMWATCRGLAAAVCGVAIPSYNTPYYGTSGFDGTTTASYEWTPFKDYPKSWKDVFFDPPATDSEDLVGFPNWNHRADAARQIASGYNSTTGYVGPIVLEGNGNYNGFDCLTGDFGDKSGYMQPLNMGLPVSIWINIMKITQGKTYPYWEELFTRFPVPDGIRGVQDGVYAHTSIGSYGGKAHICMINEHFGSAEGSIAEAHDDFLIAGDGGIGINTIWGQMTRSYVYSLILYHNDWADYI